MLLTIGRYQFGHICELRPERDATGIRVDAPQARFAEAKHTSAAQPPWNAKGIRGPRT